MQATAAVGVAQTVFQQIIKQLHQAIRVAEDGHAIRQRVM